MGSSGVMDTFEVVGRELRHFCSSLEFGMVSMATCSQIPALSVSDSEEDETFSRQ